MSTSIDELGEMFPQFSRDTIQDILAQAGDSAVDCLLELCSSSDQENCGLLVTPWSDESDDSGASWGGVANSGGSPVSNQASGESFPASRGWWVCWKGDRGGSSTGSGYCDKEWECAGVGSPPERGLSLWEGEVEEEVRVVVKEASPGWESVAEGTLNVNDWGMVPVVPVEDRPDSECSSVSLYGTTDPERQKLRFLTTMFAEYSLDVAMVEEVLDAVEGDLDAAVDELLEVTRENDGLSVSLESGGEVEVKGSGVRGEEVLLRLQTWSIHHGRNGTMHIQSPRAKKESSPESSDGDGDKEGDWKMVEATPALRRKAKGLCKRFGDVPKEEIVLDLLQGLHGNVETAARLLREAGLKEIKCTEKIKVPIAPSSGLNAKAAGTSSSLHGNGVDLQCMRVMPRSVNEMSQNEFQSLYYEQRGRALELGELKDQSYKRATEAYQRGDKSLAKTLSLQGRKYTQEAQKAQQQAAETIFRKRNSSIINTFAIDLHGMHVEEALEHVQETVQDFKTHMDKWPSKKIIRFVTGKGKHSPDNISRLASALTKYFKQHKLSFVVGPGYFDVDLESAKVPPIRTGKK